MHANACICMPLDRQVQWRQKEPLSVSTKKKDSQASRKKPPGAQKETPERLNHCGRGALERQRTSSLVLGVLKRISYALEFANSADKFRSKRAKFQCFKRNSLLARAKIFVRCSQHFARGRRKNSLGSSEFFRGLGTDVGRSRMRKTSLDRAKIFARWSRHFARGRRKSSLGSSEFVGPKCEKFARFERNLSHVGADVSLAGGEKIRSVRANLSVPRCEIFLLEPSEFFACWRRHFARGRRKISLEPSEFFACWSQYFARPSEKRRPL